MKKYSRKSPKDNLTSKDFKSKPKKGVRNLLAKTLGLIGQGVKNILFVNKKSSLVKDTATVNANKELSLFKNIDTSTKSDWVNILDSLQKVVRNLEIGIDRLDSKLMTFDVLGASTYLLQIDILLAKNRQNFKSFQRLEKNFDHVEKDLELEFLRANNAFIDCYKTHIELLCLIKDNEISDLNGADIIRNVQVLEAQTRAQGEAIQDLNDYVLKKSPLVNLFESELFRALQRADYARRDLSFDSSYVGLTEIKKGSSSVQILRDSTQLIKTSEYKLIALNLITYYESLKHYYIFIPGKLLQDLTERMKNHIQAFIEESQQKTPDKNNLYAAMNGVFVELEAVRFIPVETRHYQSQNLHEKARVMRKQLKTFLVQTELGRAFLESYVQMTARNKLSLKRTFRGG